jgi:hypothetical protein
MTVSAGGGSGNKITDSSFSFRRRTISAHSNSLHAFLFSESSLMGVVDDFHEDLVPYAAQWQFYV